MKKLKYLKILALLFGFLATGCSEEIIRPGDGDDEDDDPIIITSPPPTNTTSTDSIS